MKMRKLLPCLMALAAIPAFASASTAVAKKVGPVSHYGTLGSANGKVIGSKTKQPAILRGMSWFWSDATGLPYYSKTVLDWATDNLKIDVIRFALGINYYGTDTKNQLSNGYSYLSAPDGYKVTIDQMIEAAIENDIYIIIDWHSHQANSEVAAAKSFFAEMAQKYGKIPNVIFEIFNEPTGSWSEVANYANQVIPGIRASSENLVIVGNPGWSSQPNAASGLTYSNLAYSLHFYAASHPVSGYGANATQAMNAGKAVFATEYGTVNYDGAGTPNSSATNAWFDFMDQNMISSCNWSLRQVQTTENGTVKNETSAFFDGNVELKSKALLDAAKTSTSGAIVKQYLVGKGRTWADSLVKGKNTGSCAFKSTVVSELAGTVATTLKSGCTYTSSNTNVIDNSGAIKGAGFAVMTGNDGSQSVITVSGVPAQTVPSFQDLTCTYAGTCTSNRAISYSGGTNREWVVTTADAQTLEGSKFTLTSLNPDIVAVKTVTCTSTSCSGSQKGKQVLVYEFKSFGTAKIVATAPAVTGYKAVQDTVTVIYDKGSNKMTNNFKNTLLAIGGVAEKLVPDTTMYHTPVTYTFNGKDSSPYVIKQGNALFAGAQNAIVQITANAPETEVYKEFHMTITVGVGDTTQAVNKGELQGVNMISTRADLPLRATVTKTQLAVSSDRKGDVEVNVFSVNGQKVMSQTVSENAILSLASIPHGSYLIVISQGASQLNVKWNKTAE